MGGASCKHEHLNQETINILHTSNVKLLWTQEIYTIQCDDCKKQLKKERLMGNLTHLNWKDKIIDTTNCKHSRYTVDEKNIEIAREQTFGGTMLRLFMGGGMDGIQYHNYYLAGAQCDRCDHKFYVRAEYSKIWEKGNQINKRTTDWAPVVIKIPTGTVYKEIYAPVK